MFHVVLFEPEIPPNTGNIMRLCANTGCYLHLIEPLGFRLEEKSLRRAGLDYREFASVQCHKSFAEFKAETNYKTLYGLTTKTTRRYDTIAFQENDALLFGPETRGLPAEILEELGENCLTLPMQANSRSLNLSNSVAVTVYEAWRQLDFKSASDK